MEQTSAVEKLATWLPGFDHISNGGLPKGRSTLVAGSAGSGKTVMAVQFIVEGIRKTDEGGVFVTFEEPPEQICRNVRAFGWDLAKYEQDGRLAFVDASPQPGQEVVTAGDFDFGALMARIEHAARKVNASRVAIDSVSVAFVQFQNMHAVRRELFRVVCSLRDLEFTTILTAERSQEYGAISRFNVEEFVSDNVIILRNVLEDEKRRRTLEILKYRGTQHGKGEFPYSITKDGMVLIPLSAMELKQRSSEKRISSGVEQLNQMCGGGFFRDSIVLTSGATGTGKTLLVTHFVSGGADAGERGLLFAFEESRDQLIRNAAGWGVDFEKLENDGLLRVECAYPETATLEDHLIRMKHVIEEYGPDRVAIDSLSALERMSTLKSFREFVIALTSFIKHKEVAGLFTATTTDLLGGASITESHISTITDSIILLRYVEMYGEMRRCLTVLKMRGSYHDKDIREFSIDNSGMHVGRAFRNVSGILAGRFTYLTPTELERMDDLFRDAK